MKIIVKQDEATRRNRRGVLAKLAGRGVAELGEDELRAVVAVLLDRAGLLDEKGRIIESDGNPVGDAPVKDGR